MTMKNIPQPNDIERRVFSVDLTAEKRSNGEMVIKGYAARFDVDSVPMGWDEWTETIAPGSFAAALASSPDVRCMFNHDPNHVLGRTASGTLAMKEDANGLYIENTLPSTPAGQSIYESIRRGDITGQSFSFRCECDGATWNDDFTKRRITAVSEIFDVGPVTFPAYPSTDVAARSRSAAMEARANAAPPPPPNGEGKRGQATNPPNKGSKMNIIERRQKATELGVQAQAILDKAVAEDRETTPEERADTKRLLDEATMHEDQANLEERTAALNARVAKPQEPRSKPIDPQPPEGTRQPITMQFGNPKAFRTATFGTRESCSSAAYRSGMWALAVLHGNERAAEWCQRNGVELRALGGTVNSKGGYVVPTEMEAAVINLIEEYGVTRGNCRISRMTSDTKDVPVRAGGLTASPVGENSAITESDKSWTNAKLVARKWGVLTRYSSEVSEDAVISIADDLAMEAGQAFAEAEDKALWDGDGSGAYHGITGVKNAILAGTKKTAPSGENTFAKITAGAVTGVIGLLPSYAKRGAKIFTNASVNGQVFTRLLMAAGGNTNALIASGQPLSFGGLPIVESTVLPSTDGSNVVIAYIGDLTQTVLFGDRRAMTMRVSADRYIEYDQMAILATERFDINVFSKGASNKVGPLIQFSTAS